MFVDKLGTLASVDAALVQLVQLVQLVDLVELAMGLEPATP